MNYIKTQIDQEFTASEQEAVLIQVKDAIDSDRLFEFYREPRNGRNVLMGRVYPKSMVKTNQYITIPWWLITSVLFLCLLSV